MDYILYFHLDENPNDWVTQQEIEACIVKPLIIENSINIGNAVMQNMSKMAKIQFDKHFKQGSFKIFNEFEFRNSFSGKTFIGLSITPFK